MLKVLITGAAGFIGSHLAERLLNDGHRVIGLDNFDPFYDRRIKEGNLSIALSHPSFTFFEMNLLDKGAYGQLDKNIDVVIHLAAKAGVRPSIESPDEYLRGNIEATQNIMNWMVRTDIKKLIFAGSSSVYGNNKKIPFSEKDNVDFPISPYAYTKKACELLTHSYHHLYDISTLCLRFFTVYGPRQRPDLAIHKFARLIYSGQPIPMFGDGTTSRDYTFINDTIDGIVRSLKLISETKESLYEVINLGNNSPVLLKDLISTIFNATGKAVNIEQYDMQPGDVDCTYADIEKAKQLLGYDPKTNLKDGITAFIKWYEEING